MTLVESHVAKPSLSHTSCHVACVTMSPNHCARSRALECGGPAALSPEFRPRDRAAAPVAIRDQSGILHRAERAFGQRHVIQLAERIGNAGVRFETRQHRDGRFGLRRVLPRDEPS
jgi:hypothetical protein